MKESERAAEVTARLHGFKPGDVVLVDDPEYTCLKGQFMVREYNPGRGDGWGRVRVWKASWEQIESIWVFDRFVRRA